MNQVKAMPSSARVERRIGWLTVSNAADRQIRIKNRIYLTAAKGTFKIDL